MCQSGVIPQALEKAGPPVSAADDRRSPQTPSNQTPDCTSRGPRDSPAPTLRLRELSLTLLVSAENMSLLHVLLLEGQQQVPEAPTRGVSARSSLPQGTLCTWVPAWVRGSSSGWISVTVPGQFP